MIGLNPRYPLHRNLLRWRRFSKTKSPALSGKGGPNLEFEPILPKAAGTHCRHAGKGSQAGRCIKVYMTHAALTMTVKCCSSFTYSLHSCAVRSEPALIT